jgi:hypothetical protein
MSHPRLQAQNSANFDQFTDIVMRLLNAAWGEGWGTFCEAFPNGTEPNSVKLPVITYMLKEMVPGVIGNQGTREIKPRHRGSFKQEADGIGPQHIDVYGRVFDCEVVFEIWEENNTKATELATRFMDFMDMYTGYIKSQGVKEVIFRRYSNEMESGEWKDSISCRSLYYYVRLEHLNEVPSDVIEKVTGIVGTPPGLSDDSINEAITFNLGKKL